ncbi:MAG: hypothetical protein P1P64_05805 [Treponemataceae bacterium]
METKSYFYVPFAKRTDFNNAVGHCQSVIDILNVEDENVADTINKMMTEKEIVPDAVLPIIYVVLLDKKGYTASSINLEAVCKDPQSVIDEISKWHGVDIVLGYHHPDLGFLVFNPKNPANVSVFESLRKNELLNIYVGKGDEKIDKKLSDKVVNALLKLIYDNRKTRLPASVTSGDFVFEVEEPPVEKVTTTRKKKAPARRTSSQTTYTEDEYEVPEYLRREPVASTPVGRKNMSPLVSVLVSNELFHNGNVEAWKRIIRAYNAKYPNAEVMVFYEGERIVDINTLFKWGKVKHGTMIQFSVADENIRDLSKLRKYLTQGASQAFGAFLKGSPDTVLNLF